MSATDKQVGGEHYQTAIQPIQFILANGLGFCEGNAIKYLVRYKTKGTPLQDLEKAKHYIEFLIEQMQRERADSELNEQFVTTPTGVELGHCELSGDMTCVQPLSTAASRCELCRGCLDPQFHPAPTARTEQ